jgi:hypothetical protein
MKTILSLLILLICSSCLITKVNWKDNVKNPSNKCWRDSSQVNYIQHHYYQCGDSTLTWYYNHQTKLFYNQFKTKTCTDN